MGSPDAAPDPAPDETTTWQFGLFDVPTATRAGSAPELDDADACTCTSTAGAGGGFRS